MINVSQSAQCLTCLVTCSGSGLMGGGIAMCFANAGIPVIVLDVKQEFLDRGMKLISDNYARSAKKGSLSKEQMSKRLSLITPTLSYDSLSGVDLAIEAVFEKVPYVK